MKRYRLGLILLLLFTLLMSVGCGCGDDDDDNDDTTADDDDTADNDDDNDTSGDDDTDQPPDYPNDDRLRLNHLQALGTHNSYHLRPQVLFHESHDYSHQPLDEQLDLGVRQFELDLHWVPGQGLLVYHIPVVDQETTCRTLTDCLGVLKDWSDGHPGHHPLLVFLEPKNDLGVSPIAEHFLDVEAAILSVWERERIIAPDDVRGGRNTLREAVTEDGWPTLGQSRNRIIFHAHSLDEFLDNYRDAYPGLAGALMFTDSRPEDPFAAIMPMNNPVEGGPAIAEAVAQGFIVRSMAGGCCEQARERDYSRFEAALAAGSHFISTDFPAPTDDYDYFLEIPDGTPSRCNPQTAPAWCVPEDIEALAR